MRVAIDATPLLGNPTGIGVVTNALLRELASRDDVDARAFTMTWRGRALVDDLVPAGIDSTTRPAPARAIHWLWQRVPFPPAELVCGAHDVVHGPNYIVPPSWRGVAVVTVNDLTCVHHPDWCLPPVRAYPRLIQKAIDRGAWVHTISHHVGREVADVFDVDPDRVVPIPIGVDPAPAEAAPWPDRVPDEPFLLMLGTIEPRKNHPTVLAAFDTVAAEEPDLRLVVAGPDGWGRADYDRALASCRHADRVITLGYVDDRARHALLSHAAALVYASADEGFGLPPLEAMQRETAVVATAAGAIPEVVGPAAELAPPGDIGELAAAITRVLEPERAHELVRLGADRPPLFTWPAASDALVELYRTAIRSD